MTTLSQASSPAAVDWWELLINGGIGIFIVVAFMKGWIHTDREFQREAQRADKYEQLTLRSINAGETIAHAAKNNSIEDIERVAFEAAQRALKEASG